MPEKTAEQSRGAETETAILEAARDLLAAGGLEALSMRAVAARVGVTATAIYNYYESKSDLVQRVVRLGFERFARYLRDAIHGLPHGSAERLRALGGAYVRFALENKEYFQVIFGAHGEERHDVGDLPDGGGYDLFRQTIVEAMDAGSIRRADPDLVALYLWTHVHGLVTILMTCEPDVCCEHTGRKLRAPELFELFGDFVYNGLRPQAANDA
jgi:AcrR family transcriptional regulator